MQDIDQILVASNDVALILLATFQAAQVTQSTSIRRVCQKVDRTECVASARKKKQKQKTEPILRIGTPLYRQSAINEKAKRTYKWTDEWLDGLSNIFKGASQHLKAF